MPEHLNSSGCWCEPYLYHTSANGGKVWVHRCEGDGEPPLTVLAEAVARTMFDEEEEE